MNRLVIVGVGILIALSLNSCFSKYILTDKELEEHYAQKNFKPVHHSLNYAKKKLHYVEFGDSSKPLLLLIHGAPGAWYTWMNFTDDDSVRTNFHVIAIDRLGYGKSNYGKAERDIMEQVCSIQSVIDQFPNKQLLITGRSYGAPIAAVLAAMNERRCTSLYLFSPVISPYKEKMYWFSGLGKVFFVKWMLPKALNVATVEKYAHVSQMKQLLAFYPEVKANTVIVAGEKDWVAHPSNYKVCDSLVCGPQKRKVLIKEGNHFLTFQYPKTLSSLIYKPFAAINEEQVNLNAKAETTEKQAISKKR
ncbi:MAG: alpha/beta hydrolase [Bacteroidota bacterium]|nr:alpha/beta hydrolase [Bacteroidota bacterium]